MADFWLTLSVCTFSTIAVSLGFKDKLSWASVCRNGISNTSVHWVVKLWWTSPSWHNAHVWVLCSHYTWLDPFWSTNSWWLGMSVEVQSSWIKFKMLIRHPSTAPDLALYNTALDKEFKLINGGVIWQNDPNCDCLHFFCLILINPV